MKSLIQKLKYILTNNEKGKLAGLIAGSIILSMSEVFSIGILIPIMVLFINPEKIHANWLCGYLYKVTGVGSDKAFFAILITAAIVLFTLKSVYSVIMIYSQQKIIIQTYNRLTKRIFHSYLNKPYSFYLSNNSSISFKNLIAEVNQFTFGFLSACIIIVSEAIVFLGILIFLLSTYTTATLFFIAVFGSVMLAINMLFRKRIKAYSARRDLYGQKIYKTAMEALSAVKEIQVYGVQKFFTEKLALESEDYTVCQMKFTVMSAIPKYILETILFVSVLLFILGCILINKCFTELVPMMTLIAMASIRLIPSITKIYTNVNFMQFYTYSLDIMHNILKEEGEEKGPKLARPAAQHEAGQTQSINLSNVSFRYESAHKPLFEKLDLVIPLKKSVAIVGSTGTGKSTLIDVIMGLLTPTEGSVYYMGSRVSDDSILSYREKIGYVPQQIALIDDTIEANIAFGVPYNDINRNNVEHAVRVAQLESFVNGLPCGLKTEIGERGVRLSGGQRQRIGIARALYRRPEVIILDEATSALDRHTEDQFYDAIKGLKGGYTFIIVTHRLSAIKNADIIYVMDKGKIVDKGDYDTLVERSTAFQGIAKKSMLEK